MAAEFPGTLPTFAFADLSEEASDFPQNAEIAKLQLELLAVCSFLGAGGAAASYGPRGVNALVDSYTLVLGDAGKLVTLNKASGVTLTVPTFATVAFPVGTEIFVQQLGAGLVTVAAAGGVTINGRLTVPFQHALVVLRKLATNTWEIANVAAAAAAWTQTYATADRTVSAATAVAVATTGAALTSYGYTEAQANALITSHNAVIDDLLQLRKLVNALIDNEQARGEST